MTKDYPRFVVAVFIGAPVGLEYDSPNETSIAGDGRVLWLLQFFQKGRKCAINYRRKFCVTAAIWMYSCLDKFIKNQGNLYYSILAAHRTGKGRNDSLQFCEQRACPKLYVGFFDVVQHR